MKSRASVPAARRGDGKGRGAGREHIECIRCLLTTSAGEGSIERIITDNYNSLRPKVNKLYARGVIDSFFYVFKFVLLYFKKTLIY